MGAIHFGQAAAWMKHPSKPDGSLLHDQGHPLIESGAIGLFVVVQAIFLIPGARDE